MSNRELIDEAMRMQLPGATYGAETGYLSRLIRRLAAALEAQEWQPIETAPIEESVLTSRGKKIPFVAAKDEEGWASFNGYYENDFGIPWEPTHWRPLPPAPETEA